jgi:hypothetical protein
VAAKPVSAWPLRRTFLLVRSACSCLALP